MKKLIIYLVVLFSAVWSGSTADAAIIVGRISHVEGDIYRYMDVDDSWVETQLQSPAGIEDVLATGQSSRAEITFPNNLLLRVAENTEIEILELDDDLGVLQLNSGLARFYNLSVSGRLAIETARGTAKVAPGSIIDVKADGGTVVVSAVQGEATFQSLRNGGERLEVISGSTSLEFREESVIAGRGPVSWDWDSWCANREEIWAKNRKVRSEYLPESMQEYAYEVEPYGSWSRVYYRGYYYWAWKPHYVAAGWSPYTNGYWYDWHDSPVWMDSNPWGWVTHHHGHWIDMHGSWMWTPYVHVSHVPGVTVIGFNITFGKTYRPHWHPGRVRWISHNDYIGWFPLAPWETYYGYRRWGAGTVLVQGGSGFSLSINLSNHRHIDHAIIIPKQHLHKRGPVVVNNYNTVKIRNINKTVIVKDYKPMLTAERERARTHTRVKSVRGSNTDSRPAFAQPQRKEAKARETVKYGRPEKRDGRAIQMQRDTQKERSAESSWQRDSRQTIAKEQRDVIQRKRENRVASEREKKIARPEQRARAQNILKQEKPLQRNGIAANSSQRTQVTKVTREDRDQAETRIFRQARVETSSRSKVVQKKATEGIKRDRGDREQAQRATRQPQRQVARNEDRTKKENLQNSREYTGKTAREENKTEQQISRNENSFREKNASRGRNTDRQGSGREWISASLNNRRLR